jgi:hypothetical protein
LNDWEENLQSAAIDPASGYAYFGGWLWGGYLVQVRLSDFARTGTINLDPDEGGPVSAVIDPADGHAYFGADTMPGVVVRVNVRAAPTSAGVTDVRATSAARDDAPWLAACALLLAGAGLLAVRRGRLTSLRRRL